MMFGFVFLLIIFWFFFFNPTHSSRSMGSIYEHRDALDLLRERYARGEMSQEEFLERKQELMR